MKKSNYNIISIETLAKESNVLSETNGFIISRNAANIEDYLIFSKQPHIVEGFLIAYCLKGQAELKVNLTVYQLYENTMAIATPNHIVQILDYSEDLQIEFLFFSFDLIPDIGLRTEIRDIGKIMEERPCLYLKPEDFTELLNIHGSIVRQYRKSKTYRQDIIKNLLYALCYQILQLYLTQEIGGTERKSSRGEDIYKKFMSLLFQHYKTQRSIQFYASELSLTPKYFSRIIREISYKSASDLIDEMVVTAAKALLKSSDLTVSQIADELHFPNPSFFGVYFKKRVGMTPLEYRER